MTEFEKNDDPDAFSSQGVEQQPDYEERYGVLTRVRLGRALLALSAIEVPAGIVSVATESSAPIALGTAACTWIALETLHELHRYRRSPANELPHFLRWISKDPNEA